MKKFLIMIFLILVSSAVSAKQINLVLPTACDSSHAYFHDLLNQSLDLIGYNLTIEAVGPMPQSRIVHELKRNKISLYWLVESELRNKKYTPVEVGITDGSIGKRVLLIRQGSQKFYNDIKTLDDFRKLDLVGGFGKGWFDVDVWETNDLPYMEITGDWKKLYKMIAVGNRGVDYFSRGTNEIVNESYLYPFLEIEKKLLFVYNRDFRFYLSNASSRHKTVLEKALNKAIETGLMNSLIHKHWTKDFNVLDINNRIHLKLKNK